MKYYHIPSGELAVRRGTLVEHEWSPSLFDVLGDLEGVTAQKTLTDEMVQRSIDVSETEGD